MTLFKRFIVLLLFVMATLCVLAQGEFADSRESLHYNVNQFGIKINSNGFGLLYSFSQRVNYRLRRSYEVEIDYLKSLKELKVVNSYFEVDQYNPKKFVFGKLNSVHNLRIGYGYNRMIFEKRDKNSISIHLVAYLGFSFAVEKPIYYDIVDSVHYQSNGGMLYYINPHKFSDYKGGNVTDIAGRSKIRYGFNEMKIRPGNYIKLALNFDFANEAMNVNIIELGIICDYYYMPVTIMYNNPHNFMSSLYLSYQFGKKYNTKLNRDYQKSVRKNKNNQD